MGQTPHPHYFTDDMHPERADERFHPCDSTALVKRVQKLSMLVVYFSKHTLNDLDLTRLKSNLKLIRYTKNILNIYENEAKVKEMNVENRRICLLFL